MKISGKTVKALEDVVAFESGRPHGGRVTRVMVGDIDVKVIRERLKLSQEAFAEKFGFSLATLKNWEQGRREPEEAAKTLLRLIENQPKLVEKEVRVRVTFPTHPFDAKSRWAYLDLSGKYSSNGINIS